MSPSQKRAVILFLVIFACLVGLVVFLSSPKPEELLPQATALITKELFKDRTSSASSEQSFYVSFGEQLNALTNESKDLKKARAQDAQSDLIEDYDSVPTAQLEQITALEQRLE